MASFIQEYNLQFGEAAPVWVSVDKDDGPWSLHRLLGIGRDVLDLYLWRLQYKRRSKQLHDGSYKYSPHDDSFWNGFYSLYGLQSKGSQVIDSTHFAKPTGGTYRVPFIQFGRPGHRPHDQVKLVDGVLVSIHSFGSYFTTTKMRALRNLQFQFKEAVAPFFEEYKLSRGDLDDVVTLIPLQNISGDI